jgi:hypothetical protein
MPMVMWRRASRLGLGLSLFGGPVLAQSLGDASEYEIKAAYLLNFTRYVQWPPTAFAGAEPFTICIVGPDHFGETLDQLVAGREVQGRSIRVLRLRDPQQPGACHIAYLSDGAGALGEAGTRLGADPVLLVGSGEDFARSGGTIGFVLQEQTVRFQINAGAARLRGLRISSRVMTLATAVYEEAP